LKAIGQILKVMVRFRCCLLLLGFTLICTASLYGQRLDWAYGYAAAAVQAGEKVVFDHEGNIITLGRFEGTIDFNPGGGVLTLTANPSVDIFITKSTSDGELLWAGQFLSGQGQIPYSLATDELGDIYITGHFNGTIDFDPGPSVFQLNSGGGQAGFVTKLNSNGEFVWARHFHTSGYSPGFDIVVDSLKNVYLTGIFGGTVDFDPGAASFELNGGFVSDAYIVKLDHNGQFVWAKQITSESQITGYGLEVSRSGDVFAVGVTSGEVDLDPGPDELIVQVDNTNSSSYFIRLDENGNLAWAHVFNHVIVRIRSDGSDRFYMTGKFDRSSDFDPDTSQAYLNGSASEGFVAAYDEHAGFLWARKLGPLVIEVFDMAVDPVGGIVISGSFSGSINPPPLSGNQAIVSRGDRDAFIALWDIDGLFQGAAGMGATYLDRGYGCDINPVGDVVVTGEYKYGEMTFDFDPDSTVLSFGGLEDFFIAKYHRRGVTGSVFLDLNYNCERHSEEPGVWGIRGIIQPGDIVVETNRHGQWSIDSLPPGDYEVAYDTVGPWFYPCSHVMPFAVVNSDTFTRVQPLGVVSLEPCPKPEISVVMPIIRRCFSNQEILIEACNGYSGTDILYNGAVDLILDPLLVFHSASVPHVLTGHKRYLLVVGELLRGECK
jgi:hypothetical protein